MEKNKQGKLYLSAAEEIGVMILATLARRGVKPEDSIPVIWLTFERLVASMAISLNLNPLKILAGFSEWLLSEISEMAEAAAASDEVVKEATRIIKSSNNK